MSPLELHLQHQGEPASALSILSQSTELSNAQLKAAIGKGALWLEKPTKPSSDKKNSDKARASKKNGGVQRLRRVKKPINAGETLHFYYNEEVLAQAPPAAQLIDDQQSYSVWFKPSGMLSQGSKWSDHCTITRWAQLHLPNERPCFLVHRLDRATCGLILVAHTKKAAQAFTQLFEQRKLTKQYEAMLDVSQSSLASQVTINEPIDGKKAISHFSEIAVDRNRNIGHYLVDIETGRKHQIRKHALMLASPIIGDRLYNSPHSADGTANTQAQDKVQMNTAPSFDVDLQLCATRLAFTCPLTDKARDYQTPDEFKLSLTAFQSASK
ncbi:RNA pseudouridine synthase [Thalassotalea euphylliae]|uniref:RNA pseudouridine synthase n=1 Tax=Thalassotalea euphylliae TaxID=1655234 RepID=A0A3E0TTN9_9GAMM|nr:RNA pseudouridine synthase [Thalassotalea euphylliae]REL27839.1 RNA pseudouridine synthase [Thalassotalea euphylliae]